jgi:hypothetical protein
MEDVNKELWLILSICGIAGMLNYLVVSHRMVLGFYTLPTLFSAYWYGRRHATLTAFASVLAVIVVVYSNPLLFPSGGMARPGEKWYESLPGVAF